MADQFGKAIGPAVRHPMRGRGIDDPNLAASGQLYRFARRIVGQAEDREIRLVQGLAPGGGVLAPSFVQDQQRKFVPPRQPFGNFEAGGADRTINEYACRHRAPSLRRQRGNWDIADQPVIPDLAPGPLAGEVQHVE